MAVKSQISAIVANQVGKLQGELENRIQEESFKLISKFANQCPSPKELVKIVKTRNNLLSIVNGFSKKVSKFSKLANTLRPAIIATKVLIGLLKANPIPTAIIPPSGGLGVRIGRVVSLADRLRTANELLDALEDDVQSLQKITLSIEPSLDNIRQTLEGVNNSIQQCIEELQESADNDQATEQVIKDLIKEIQPPENTGSEGTPDQSYSYIAPNGKQYVLAIIEDKTGNFSIPRRVAIAKDNKGVVVIKGQPSFSSNTQVLLDELKFRIDRQLP
jgi:translation initiation factor 1 (eIF-1/SUI1)